MMAVLKEIEMLWLLLACPKPAWDPIEGFIPWTEGVWLSEEHLPCSYEFTGSVVVETWLPNLSDMPAYWAENCANPTKAAASRVNTAESTLEALGLKNISITPRVVIHEECIEKREHLRRQAVVTARANAGDAIIDGRYSFKGREVSEEECEQIPECDSSGFSTTTMYVLSYSAPVIRWWSASCLEDRRPRIEVPDVSVTPQDDAEETPSSESVEAESASDGDDTEPEDGGEESESVAN